MLLTTLFNLARRFIAPRMLTLPFLGLSFIAPAAGAPDSTEVKKLVSLFEVRYRLARTLQATFLEGYTENDKLVRTEAGIAYFRRPGKMRWEYGSPERDLFLVDGKTAWFYVPADHTVMRVPAKQSTDWRTPLALLAGEMKVSRVCAKVELADHEKADAEQDVVLRCELHAPAPDPSGKDSTARELSDGGKSDVVFFEIVRDTGELVRLVVRQSGGVQVEFRFANWRFNPPMPESAFRFEVPVGVAIVNGELPAVGTRVE
jgi:outer membrane lipoprotein carrier protein